MEFYEKTNMSYPISSIVLAGIQFILFIFVFRTDTPYELCDTTTEDSALFIMEKIYTSREIQLKEFEKLKKTKQHKIENKEKLNFKGLLLIMKYVIGIILKNSGEIFIILEFDIEEFKKNEFIWLFIFYIVSSISMPCLCFFVIKGKITITDSNKTSEDNSHGYYHIFRT